MGFRRQRDRKLFVSSSPLTKLPIVVPSFATLFISCIRFHGHSLSSRRHINDWDLRKISNVFPNFYLIEIEGSKEFRERLNLRDSKFDIYDTCLFFTDLSIIYRIKQQPTIDRFFFKKLIGNCLFYLQIFSLRSLTGIFLYEKYWLIESNTSNRSTQRNKFLFAGKKSPKTVSLSPSRRITIPLIASRTRHSSARDTSCGQFTGKNECRDGKKKKRGGERKKNWG